MSESFSFFLRRLISDSHFFFAGKVMVAIIGTLLPGLFFGMSHESVILSLGVVAGAIGEPDDSVPGRMKNLAVTLLCFVIATTSVQLLYPYPWLFALGLFCSTLGFIMLGALGPRYATISFGSLLVAIYSMLGAAHAPNLWHQPLWLCIGALWYGLVSLVWLKLLPHKAVHEQLAQLFFSLGRYCHEKSRFFPVTRENMNQIRHNLAILNINCTHNMQLSKEMLSGRLSAGWDPHLERLLQLYLLAQEIHERIVSSHYLYDKLQQDIQRNEILDGFREVLEQLGLSCEQLGSAIRMHHHFIPGKGLNWVMSALQDQLAYTHLQHPFSGPLRTSLDFLQQNLNAILALLQQASPLTGHFDQPIETRESRQLTRPPHAALSDVSQQISSTSPLFRHGIRMALCLVTAYGLLQLFHIQQGFWVLLTCLFVCQSSYTATRRRVVERIAGTLLGIVLGIPLLWLNPTITGQLIGMALAAVLFFSQLKNNYSAAVTFITLYALTAFGLLGVQSNALMLPRLLDTLIGALIAFAAVMWIWPDWQYRRIPALLAQSLRQNSRYLQTIIHSIQQHADDELLYRVARRQAHLADSALAQAWQNMLLEPKSKRRFLRLCASLTHRSHSIISYISTLGAHKSRLSGYLSPEQQGLITQIEAVLEATAVMLSGEKVEISTIPLKEPSAANIASSEIQPDWLIQQELQLIAEQANELLRLTWLLEPMRLSTRD